MRERILSIDLMTSDAVKRASLEGAAFGRVTIEGTIGSLEHAKFVENSVLEVAGTRGIQNEEQNENRSNPQWGPRPWPCI